MSAISAYLWRTGRLNIGRIQVASAKLDNYQHRLDELAAVTSRAESDAAGYSERLGVAKNIAQMRKKLEAMDSGSKLTTLMATDTRAEMARSLANAERTAEGAKPDHAALASERDAYIRGWRAAASQQLSEVTGKASDAREQLNKAKLPRQLVELRSDLEAIVQSVAKVSVGSVLQSGAHFCHTTRRLRSRPILPATTVDICMSTTPW